MNNKELQALRRLFFLSTSEAAEHIGNVSTRGWQHWEAGKYNIPADVESKMNALLDHRLAMIEACESLMNARDDKDWIDIKSIKNETRHDINENDDANGIKIEYYLSFDEYKSNHNEARIIDWRLSQSVAAYFLVNNLHISNNWIFLKSKK